MPAPHQRKVKYITLSIDSNPFECQVRSWKLNNNTEDGEKIFTQCPEGEVREEADPDWSLDLTMLADWRENGISDWLTVHDGETVAFAIGHHPDRPAEHVTWTGQVIIKAPSVGDEARATENTEITLQCVGKPVYGRVGA
ncbi:hypothetical protein C1I95_12440 [Micromonospora craterilacus]|uniref:Phage tail protein n=1 Tax=Micromonospora craterilacus TaxID=1655439 RepID=A0A2W2EZH3_9ACTN|nr:hypothetical protein [Micromonospora craterilacus]PZG18980.1 hypothetical protein C1I95_12440 [Micromonospora craterilacus]